MISKSRSAILTAVIAIFLSMLFTAPVFAKGERAVDLAKITVGARQASMGSAFVGLADDINTLAFNPAGLSLLQRMTLSGSYNDWIGGSSYGFVSLGIPRKVGTFGIGLTYFNQTEVERTDINHVPTGEKVSVYDFRASLGYGAILHPYVHFGTALTLTQSKLGDVNKGYGGIDLGFLFPVMKERLILGVAARNLAMDALKTSNDTGEDLPPTSVTGGIGLFIHDFESVKINLAGDVYYPMGEEDGLKQNLGAEFVIKELLALRTGYRLNSDEESFTIGAGIHYKDFWVDYSYNDLDVLNETHRFTVTMDFGEVQSQNVIFGDSGLDKGDDDGDGIENYLDRCPQDPEDKDGYEDYDGCPDPDNDHDGIPDTEDDCPLLPETFNDYQDVDGCPDVASLGTIEDPYKFRERYLGQSYELSERYAYIVPIYFDIGSADLRPESYSLLEQLADLILNTGDIEGIIFVEGHTDNRNDHDYNQELGERRAISVKSALVNRYGVPGNILVPIGIGESEPVAPNDTEENMQKNRRVIFRVYEKSEVEEN